MEHAILMASGMGTRMRPVTDTIPKPLVTIQNKPMIETVIDGLTKRGVEKIIVVVGYLAEQFSYLTNLYPHVVFVQNTMYETVNNISSLYAAREYLLEGDCFICEADLFVADDTIFRAELQSSCYYGKYVPGHSDDWVFDLDDSGRITRVGRVGENQYNMTGIAYFKAEDARKLYRMIETEYKRGGYEKLFWDDVVNRHIQEFSLSVHAVEGEQIMEIDTVAELEQVRGRFGGS